MAEKGRETAEKGNGSGKSTMHAWQTTCGVCQQPVGILWFKGRSTLFDGKIDRDESGENLIVHPHVCPGPVQPSKRRGRNWGPIRDGGPR